MEATSLLKQQHNEVKGLFRKFEKAEQDSAKLALFEQIANALAAHCTIEEKIFYPSVYVGDLEEQLHEAVEEHLAAKRVIADLLGMSPEDEQFDAKMKVLKEEVEQHVEEEEGELFPRVEKNFEEVELVSMGERMKLVFEELLKSEPRLQVPKETAEAARLE